MRLTITLIFICLLVFVLEIVTSLNGEEEINRFFTTYGLSFNGLISGNYWTPITSIFVHADFEHLLLNMIALFFFGKVVEDEIGPKRYLLVFLGAALLGDIAVLGTTIIGLMPADIPTVGASAAIFGLLGVAMLSRPLELVIFPYIIPVPLLVIAILYAVYNVLAFALVVSGVQTSDVAYTAHLAGFAFGSYYGFRYVGYKRGILISLVAIGILISIPFVWSLLQYLELTNYTSIISRSFK